MPEIDDAAVQKAVALLRAGNVIGLPTETVYGLAADVQSAAGVARIFALKGRPAQTPLPVLIPSASAIDAWALDITEAADNLASAFWPGPLTIVLKKRHHVPDFVTAEQPTVGLRVPDHPLTLALLAAFGGGLACTSANRHGEPGPRTAAEVRAIFDDELPLVLDGGEARVGVESTVVDLSGEPAVVLRIGAISVGQLEDVLGAAVLVLGENC